MIKKGHEQVEKTLEMKKGVGVAHESGMVLSQLLQHYDYGLNNSHTKYRNVKGVSTLRAIPTPF